MIQLVKDYVHNQIYLQLESDEVVGIRYFRCQLPQRMCKATCEPRYYSQVLGSRIPYLQVRPSCPLIKYLSFFRIVQL